MCSCPHSETVSSYLLGVLRPSETEEYRQHLGTCSQCAREIADLTPVARFLKAFKAQMAVMDELDVSVLLGHASPRRASGTEGSAS